VPKSATYKSPSSIKEKYHQKTLSEDAIYTTYHRTLDMSPLFAEYVWMQLSVFDLSELGLGLLYNILPIDYQPYSIDFTYVAPTPEETLQGIWAKFEPVRFDILYRWMTDFREYILENFREEFQPDLLIGIAEKAVYGVTPYARGVYDPILAREFLRASAHKLRLLRTPDQTWRAMLEQIADYLLMIGVTDDNVFNRIMMLFSAQTQSFVLGLSMLGRSYLSTMEEEYAKIPFLDAQGNIHDLKFRALDHLQLGFILWVTPLGYGLLLPKESIYKLPEGKRNPSIIKVMMEKIRGIIFRLTLSTWSYSNYNRPEEMINYHKSDRANQYDLLQTQRRMVESWVYTMVPPEESNAVRIRQYQNAILQAIGFKAKRHKWGFQLWRHMTEDQFYEWWLDYWTKQGLTKETLANLYQTAKTWLVRLRSDKIALGEKIKKRRKQLALTV